MQSRVASSPHDNHQWIHAADRAARATARRRRLSPDAMEELRSELWLKILRDDQRILARFEGRGSLLAFLSSVADRCLLDQRVRVMGKWRPTQTARRAGTVGIALDRLTRRDGFSLDEAIEHLTHNLALPVADIRAMAQALPTSQAPPKRRTVPLDDAVHLPARSPSAEANLDLARAMDARVRVRTILARCLDDLRPADRQLLMRRFADGVSVADIARSDGSNQKALYRQLQAVLSQLRRRLERSGVSPGDALGLLGRGDSPLDGLMHRLAESPDGPVVQN